MSLFDEGPAIFTVTTLNRYIKDLMESDLTLQSLWVRGEISNFTRHTSGHLYFTLKDSTGRIRSVMFKGSAMKLKFRPEEGLKVIALGSISVYDKSGDYQFYCEHMEPEGKGALYAAYEQLKARLEAEGLFDAKRKRPLPAYPKHIAVCTSPTGAAVRDIITIARRRWPGVRVTVVPTLVQGDTAPASIIDSLGIASTLPGVEAVIVGRGGGSIEELWAFNDEGVARAISSSRVPVVSAVGHETDFTIADFVADLRAPTPSGAAEMMIPDMIACRAKAEALAARLAPALSGRVESGRQRLRMLIGSPVLTQPLRGLDQRRQQIDGLSSNMTRAMEKKLMQLGGTLAEAVGQLEVLSPLQVLSRGYAICTDDSGAVVRDASEVVPGQGVGIRLGKGSLECIVQRIPDEQSGTGHVTKNTFTVGHKGKPKGEEPDRPSLFD